jgi:polysaccharide export outer membrane protein
MGANLSAPMMPMRGGLPAVKAALRVAAAALALLGGGCSQTAGNFGGQNLGIETKSLPTPPAPTPKLEHGDRLRVTVFNEPQLSGEFVVDGAGAIAFPLVGQVQVTALEAQEVEQALTDRLKGRYLVNPKIVVEFLSLRPFYILGEIMKSGEYTYRPGLNAVSAVAMAGGFTPRAATSYVLIRRANDNKEQEFPLDSSVPVYPGDMITIAERLF